MMMIMVMMIIFYYLINIMFCNVNLALPNLMRFSKYVVNLFSQLLTLTVVFRPECEHLCYIININFKLIFGHTTYEYKGNLCSRKHSDTASFCKFIS